MKVIVTKSGRASAEFSLYDGMNTLGRDVTNRIRLLDPRVSRRHCKIRKIGQSLFLFDLGTKNGTRVNGTRVTTRELKLGDRIKVGNTTLELLDDDYGLPKQQQRSGAGALLRRVGGMLLGQEQSASSVETAYPKLYQKRRKAFWRPSVDTDPPEGRSDTVISCSDPD